MVDALGLLDDGDYLREQGVGLVGPVVDLPAVTLAGEQLGPESRFNSSRTELVERENSEAKARK